MTTEAVRVLQFHSSYFCYHYTVSSYKFGMSLAIIKNKLYLRVKTELTHCQETSTTAPSTVYISSSGYVGFFNGSTSLIGSGTNLQLRFKACSSDGLLLYAEDNSGMEYFAVGLFGGHLLVESRNAAGSISDVCHCILRKVPFPSPLSSPLFFF